MQTSCCFVTSRKFSLKDKTRKRHWIQGEKLKQTSGADHPNDILPKHLTLLSLLNSPSLSTRRNKRKHVGLLSSAICSLPVYKKLANWHHLHFYDISRKIQCCFPKTPPTHQNRQTLVGCFKHWNRRCYNNEQFTTVWDDILLTPYHFTEKQSQASDTWYTTKHCHLWLIVSCPCYTLRDCHNWGERRIELRKMADGRIQKALPSSVSYRVI